MKNVHLFETVIPRLMITFVNPCNEMFLFWPIPVMMTLKCKMYSKISIRWIRSSKLQFVYQMIQRFTDYQSKKISNWFSLNARKIEAVYWLEMRRNVHNNRMLKRKKSVCAKQQNWFVANVSIRQSCMNVSNRLIVIWIYVQSEKNWKKKNCVVVVVRWNKRNMLWAKLIIDPKKGIPANDIWCGCERQEKSQLLWKKKKRA